MISLSKFVNFTHSATPVNAFLPCATYSLVTYCDILLTGGDDSCTSAAASSFTLREAEASTKSSFLNLKAKPFLYLGGMSNKISVRLSTR